MYQPKSSVPLATSITGSNNIATDKAVKDYVDSKSSGTGESKPPIEDVEELPEIEPNVDSNYLYRTSDNSIYQLATKDVISYTGTTVNNTGTVSTVYFNDKLSLFETTSLLMKLDYVDTPFLDYPIAPLLFSSSGSPVIFAVQTDDGYEINVSTDITNGEFDRVFINYEFQDVVGWHMNSYNINSTVISNYQGISVGSQNELISNLFSSTSFIKNINKVKEFKPINNPVVVHIDNIFVESGTLTDEEIEILKGDNAIIIAGYSIPDVGKIEMVFKKSTHFDVSDMKMLSYSNLSSMTGSYSADSITISLDEKMWMYNSTDTLATYRDIKNIYLYDEIQENGEITLRFLDFDSMTHHLGTISVEKQISYSGNSNALVTHEAVKNYVDSQIGLIDTALASILGEE